MALQERASSIVWLRRPAKVAGGLVNGKNGSSWIHKPMRSTWTGLSWHFILKLFDLFLPSSKSNIVSRESVTAT